ncbi:MAG: DoxX family protein [bacterium]|nr:DoxX family protein [bacterium]
MNGTLWFAQLTIGLLFLLAGSVQLFAVDGFRARVEWAKALPSRWFRFVGLTELACALCLLLPALTHSDLAAAAAAVLGVMMGAALVFHLRRRDRLRAWMSAAAMTACLFVAIGRFFLWPLF